MTHRSPHPRLRKPFQATQVIDIHVGPDHTTDTRDSQSSNEDPVESEADESDVEDD